jgi:hypothetical protein
MGTGPAARRISSSGAVFAPLSSKQDVAVGVNDRVVTVRGKFRKENQVVYNS